MKLLFVATVSAALFALVFAAPKPIEEIRQQSAVRYNEKRDGRNQYELDFETAEGIRIEERGQLRNGANNTVYLYKSGRSTWTDENGVTYVTNWSSDEGGFHAQGDHLPTPVPEAAH